MADVPAALASIDNQGNAETCSLFAISKAVCNGFETKKFPPGYLDFDQGRISTVLLDQINDKNVLKAKYPTEFDGKSFPMQDKKSDYYDILLSIKEVETADDFKKQRNENKEHLIVTDLKNGLQCVNARENGHHCLYVYDYDSANDYVTCLNSWGDYKPSPDVKLEDIKHYYEVSAEACALPLQQSNSSSSSVTSVMSSLQLNSSPSASSSVSVASPQQVQVAVSEEDIQNIETIIKNYETLKHIPKLTEIMQAARLVSGGHITSIKCLSLRDINLDKIPPQELSLLVSCVTDTVYIRNVKGDLENVLKNASCRLLHFLGTTLDQSKTELLVEALEERVKNLNIGTGVTLDLDMLQSYEGSGKCWRISLWCTPTVSNNYKTFLESFAKILEWKSEEGKKYESGDYWFVIKRRY